MDKGVISKSVTISHTNSLNSIQINTFSFRCVSRNKTAVCKRGSVQNINSLKSRILLYESHVSEGEHVKPLFMYVELVKQKKRTNTRWKFSLLLYYMKGRVIVQQQHFVQGYNN